MIKTIKHPQYVGLQLKEPTKSVVHIFDLDDTITSKPEGFDNTGMSKDEFFDASRDFTPDMDITWLLRFLHSKGDAIAVCTARPPERLTESYHWLRKWRLPVDVLMLSTGRSPSGMAKQHMIKHLRRKYNRIGTMIDDSQYNVQGARLQKVGAIHVVKNEAYWRNNPEVVLKV